MSIFGDKLKVGFYGVLGVIILVVSFSFVGWEKVEGDEAAVLQDWSGGVRSEVWRDGTHFYIPVVTDVHLYNIGIEKVTFASNKEAEYAPIEVNVGENGGQRAKISLSVNYRIAHTIDEDGKITFSPERLIALHRELKKDYESIVLKRTIVEVVNRIARPKSALEIYSGTGYNLFVEEVQAALHSHKMFRNNGILIESVIVYNVNLNPEYEKEIESKQLAIQKTLRENEEEKAAVARAARAKQEAQAEVETRTQKAEAAKQERIKAAEAEKAEQVLQAQGQKEAQILKAEGILAQGRAEAEVQELKREALYAGSSGALRAKVEIAQARAVVSGKILGTINVLPEKTFAQLGEGLGIKATVPGFNQE